MNPGWAAFALGASAAAFSGTDLTIFGNCHQNAAKIHLIVIRMSLFSLAVRVHIILKITNRRRAVVAVVRWTMGCFEQLKELVPSREGPSV